VISFYHDFRQAPPPRRVVKLCGAEACQARGVARLAAELEARLTGRADVAIETVYCLGLCASGPAALIDGRPFGRLDADRLEQVLAEAEA
jgi:formate dehydrogenase subunit gamma